MNTTINVNALRATVQRILGSLASTENRSNHFKELDYTLNQGFTCLQELPKGRVKDELAVLLYSALFKAGQYREADFYRVIEGGYATTQGTSLSDVARARILAVVGGAYLELISQAGHPEAQGQGQAAALERASAHLLEADTVFPQLATTAYNRIQLAALGGGSLEQALQDFLAIPHPHEEMDILTLKSYEGLHEGWEKDEWLAERARKMHRDLSSKVSDHISDLDRTGLRLLSARQKAVSAEDRDGLNLSLLGHFLASFKRHGVLPKKAGLATVLALLIVLVTLAGANPKAVEQVVILVTKLSPGMLIWGLMGHPGGPALAAISGGLAAISGGLASAISGGLAAISGGL